MKFLFFLLMVFCAYNLRAESANLIQNPDFEQGEKNGFAVGYMDYFYYKTSNPAVKITLDPESEFITGEKSLKIDGSKLGKDEQGGVRSVSFRVDAGGKYVFSTWLKSKDAGTIARLIIKDSALDKKDDEIQKILDYKYISPIGEYSKYIWKEEYFKINTEWHKYELKIEIPNIPNISVYVSVLLKGTGVLWLDGLKFEVEK